MFDQILERNKPNLEPSRLNIKDVNGNTIIAYGQSIMNLNFNGKQFPQTIIVCDISPDAIIGQDFLLHYVNKIDYQRMVLQTSLTDIQCWVAGETQMVCRVEVKEETTIPANSRMFIPVDIPFCEKLSESCMIEPSVRLFDEKNIAILPAILQSSTENKVVSLHNFNDTDVKIYPKMKLGDCESYYEKNSTAVCCTEVSLDENPGESNLPEYLKELWERSCIHLNENESTDFANLLKRYKNVFSKSSDDIGRTNLIQHEINTGNAVPIRQPPRRLSFGKRQIEKDEIQRMLKLGVIEPSTSSWSSPVVLIAKKGGQGGTRFCVDFRGVNGLMTEKIAYPIPRIDDCLDALSTASFYGCMDLNSGFWQLEMKESDKEKTAFATSQGLYQFIVMPFGLANAPNSFQRLMESVLRGLQWEECLLYLDDIIVPASTVQESIERLELVFQRLLDAGLKLKPSKCIFFQKKVKFLGHIVSENGIQTDPEKTEAVQKWPRSKNQKQMHSFLGLCSYYRRFVSKFAEIARPLHKLCEKYAAFNWTDICEEAFTRLKEVLTSPPILGYPIIGSNFILDTDASD